MNTAKGFQRIIDAKTASAEIVVPTVETLPRIVNLMDALKKSLDAGSATKKKPAKAAVTRPHAAKERTHSEKPAETCSRPRWNGGIKPPEQKNGRSR
jgi:hypothetical protein